MYGEDVGDFVFVELRQVLAVTIVSHVELGEDLLVYGGGGGHMRVAILKLLLSSLLLLLS